MDEAKREEMGKHLKKNEIKMFQTRILLWFFYEIRNENDICILQTEIYISQWFRVECRSRCKPEKNFYCRKIVKLKSHLVNQLCRTSKFFMGGHYIAKHFSESIDIYNDKSLSNHSIDTKVPK